jgi:hypothetical protein
MTNPEWIGTDFISVKFAKIRSSILRVLEEAISHIVARQRLEKQWLPGNVFQQYCNMNVKFSIRSWSDSSVYKKRNIVLCAAQCVVQ